MNEILISIIIPAHNAEHTIENTVHSILKQNETEKKVEILVIENGSTDNTIKVVEHLSSKYDNLRLLHSDKGVTAARNKGVEEAFGEWIVFVDADDELMDDTVKVLVSDALDASADMYFYGHLNGNEARSVFDGEEKAAFSSKQLEDCKIMMLSNPTRYLQVWAKLIRRKLIVENKISFHKDLRLAEDSDYMLRCIEVAQNVKIKPEIIYKYKVSESSVMRTFDEGKIRDYSYAM